MSAIAKAVSPRMSPRAAARQIIDLDGELDYWREHYRTLPGYVPVWSYNDLAPALKLGIDTFLRQPGRSFDEVAHKLPGSYARLRGLSPVDWNEAEPFAAAAWQRLDQREAPPPRPRPHPADNRPRGDVIKQH